MKPKKQSSGAVAGILLPMGLLCLFAFCSLALALMGGSAYKEIQAGVDDAHDSTVAASYLRTKLSQNSDAAQVALRDEGVYELLVITSTEGGNTYETRIYMDGNVLRESFVQADTPFSPSGGTTIAQLKACTFQLEDGLFTATLESPEGTQTRTAFALNEGGRV